MKDEGKPVDPKREQLEALIKEAVRQFPDRQNGRLILPDFTNTEIAFRYKSDKDLRKAYRLFRLMNNPWLVSLGSALAVTAVKWGLPFAERLVENTVFRQFCGGTSLEETSRTIERLYRYQVLTILDYGAEGKETEADFEKTMRETVRAVQFAATHESVPVVSSKISGLASNALLEEVQGKEPESEASRKELLAVEKRLDKICAMAAEQGVAIFFDAEESWYQDTINFLVNRMMARYNKERAVVYNTFQLYRTDQLDYLKASYEKARKEGYVLGAKLVRGAYMDKERERARQLGYPSPIHPTKEATDKAYNEAVEFCVEHYTDMASANASHNEESNRLQAELIAEKGIVKNHPHLNFCQLYGMSDHLTFNLAQAGYNVAKYLPYGPVKEVLPYLIRRAEENTSITGDMSRELALIKEEIKRRKLG